MNTHTVSTVIYTAKKKKNTLIIALYFRRQNFSYADFMYIENHITFHAF